MKSGDHDSLSSDPGATSTLRIPEKPNLEGLEERWSTYWQENDTYRFDRSASRAEVYSIDTPPPTVSGSLHVGHVFNYTQIDIFARYKRMAGYAVFFPVGWDDNGLATERRVQNFYGVRCDPSIAEEQSVEIPEKKQGEPIPISRPSFVELCRQLVAVDELAFEELFRHLGLSIDWRYVYTTIGEHSRRTSQRAFLHLVQQGLAYRQEAPTLWDVDSQTAIAQAELEDREVSGAYYRLRFTESDDSDAVIAIETTRPELLPACVALVAHPDDSRYAHLFGKTARTPLFGVDVPIRAHHLAEPEKGSGIAMVCTFGDLTDVTWWRELSLSTRTIVGRDGHLEEVLFGQPGWESAFPESANRAYQQLEGLTVRAAQRRIVELLGENGGLLAEPRPITHPVKFYERGDRPLEIVSSKQWYIRTMDSREEFLEAGRKLKWHPPFMRARYESWINGLTGDWNISRQRFFGVPFPVWYPVEQDGTIGLDPIYASDDRLPIDPSTETPSGFDSGQRGQPGGFVGDPDVFDTWATSSLTPQIAGGWESDPDLFSSVFPMDLRPQAHEIIRTWLFTTVVRSHFEHHELPWQHAAISGWILDPDRKKMSKSKGNVVVPTELLEKHGTDAARYWSASARLGVDTIFDEQQMQIGRRLSIKILNATKFVLSRLAEIGASTSPVELSPEPLDGAMLGALRQVVIDATKALDDYEHAKALDLIEQFFWTFCDDYLELVKTRAYGDGPNGPSARRALSFAIDVVLRLFAPYLPFVTEEAWSWSHDDSIHLCRWPQLDEFVGLVDERSDPKTLETVANVLREIRREKTQAKKSMRAPVARVDVEATEDLISQLRSASDDLKDAGCIEVLNLSSKDVELRVEVELAS